jgi:hypothetical protein
MMKAVCGQLAKIFEKFFKNPLTNATKCGIIIVQKGGEISKRKELISMKMFSEMSLKAIRAKLAEVGVIVNDNQFNALTYSELKKVYKKSKKAYKLYEEVDTIISKKKAPTPEVPTKSTVGEGVASSKNKIIKGA